MKLAATILSQLLASYSAAPDIGSATEVASDRTEIYLSDGVANGQAQKYYQDSATIAASGLTTYDLAGGINDAFGNVLTLSKVKVIRIRASANNTNNVVVGGAASNTFVGPFGAAANTLAIQPGGELLLVAPNAGYTVTAGTGDQLQIANSGAGSSVDYTIELIGY